MIKKSRAQRGLGKYDAPLRVQHQMGYDCFKHGRMENPFCALTLCSIVSGVGGSTEPSMTI